MSQDDMEQRCGTCTNLHKIDERTSCCMQLDEIRQTEEQTGQRYVYGVTIPCPLWNGIQEEIDDKMRRWNELHQDIHNVQTAAGRDAIRHVMKNIKERLLVLGVDVETNR